MYVLCYRITKGVIHIPFVLCFVIQLPEVCSYQAIEYTVVVWENGTSYSGSDILVLQVNGTCNETCSRKKINLFSLGHSRLMTYGFFPPSGQESNYVKEELAKITVETAKKMWPQVWKTFLSDLEELRQIGVSHCSKACSDHLVFITSRCAQHGTLAL